MNRSMIIPALCAVLALPAQAADQPSLERGRELFTGTTLGTNGKRCTDCHQGGNKLAAVSGYDDSQLGEIVNRCIRKPLEGKGLDPGSADMKSLLLYVRSLAGSGR